MDIVLNIYRIHWAIENNKLRRLKYSNHFIEYFTRNCSYNDIKSYYFESTPCGLFELIYYIQEWILMPFGYPSSFVYSQIRNHQNLYLHYNTESNLKSIVLTRNVYALVLDSTRIELNFRYDY